MYTHFIDKPGSGETCNLPDHALRALAFAYGRACDDNAAIPAGYTYLLQFIGHDIVDSNVQLSRTDTPAQAVACNTRQRALRLDTLYGAGTADSTAPYSATSGRFPLDAMLPLVPGGQAPERDIARRMATAGAPACPLIGDKRNDAAVMLSQLTAAMQLAHNGLFDAMPATLAVQTRFEGARRLLETIYRRIVRDDVLPRIAHPGVLRACLDQPGRLHSQPSVSIEFSHAAFRLGHAMARNNYQMNKTPDGAVDLATARQMTSLRRPNDRPMLNEAWIMDMRRFFDIDGSSPTPSCRIGPRTSPALRVRDLSPDEKTDTPSGLAHRDLLSGARGGLWSVAGLIAKILSVWPQAPGGRLWDPCVRRQEIGAGLRAQADSVPDEATRQAFLGSVDHIARDPPLSFFILFEAAHPDHQDGGRVANAGEHLGPLGTIIVADTLLGLLQNVGKHDPIDDRPLADAFRDVANMPIPDELVADVTMPALLRLTARLSRLANTRPAFC